MRLGVFGGSFDPVHYGHLLLAECCREQCRLDRVWFVPAGIPPHKRDEELSPGEVRAEMLELAIAGNEHFAVSRYEIDRDGVSYTVDTLRDFHEREPEAELFLLVGADMLHDLPGWHDAAEICRLAVPVGVRRPGEPEPDCGCLGSIASPERIALCRRHQVEMPEIGISSTEIRRRLSAGQSIRYWTPRAVEKYLEVRSRGNDVVSGKW
jgi:nicotinate-nucleotide adenylyltransferase